MKKALLSVLFLLFLSGLAQAKSGLWDASVIWKDDPTATIAWDASKNSDGSDFYCPVETTCWYEIELRSLEVTFIDKYTVPFPNLSQEVPYKRSGHFQVFGRLCTQSNMDPAPVCSDWGDSINSGTITVPPYLPGNNKGWILYWRIPPPGGGGIE